MESSGYVSNGAGANLFGNTQNVDISNLQKNTQAFSYDAGTTTYEAPATETTKLFDIRGPTTMSGATTLSGTNTVTGDTTFNTTTFIGVMNTDSVSPTRGGGGCLTFGPVGESLTIAAEANVAFGTQCLGSVTVNRDNVAVGHQCLDSTTAGRNIGVGSKCMNNVISWGNTGIGAICATAVTGGGGLNTFVGYQTANGKYGNLANAMCLGANAGSSSSPSGVIANDTICLGDNSIDNLYCATATILTSDARDKTDITPLDPIRHGLDYVCALEPCSFRMNHRSRYTTSTVNEDGEVVEETVENDGSKANKRTDMGFLAQQVLEAEAKLGCCKKLSLIDSVNGGNNLNINNNNLFAILVNAIKALKSRVEELEHVQNKGLKTAKRLRPEEFE